MLHASFHPMAQFQGRERDRKPLILGGNWGDWDVEWGKKGKPSGGFREKGCPVDATNTHIEVRFLGWH